MVIVAGLAALTAPIATQVHGELRAPLRGRVLDREGRPWAGAVVDLIGSPSPTHWGIPGTDAITTVADDDGYFAAQARPERAYSVFAHQSIDGGGHRCSEVIDRVVPGMPAVLTEREHPQLAQRVVVASAGEDPRLASLRWKLRCRGPENVFEIPIRLDAAGGFPMPAVPNRRTCSLIATLPDGVEVFSGYVLVRSDDPRFAGGEAEVCVEVPVPSPVRFEVTGPDGEPVADAALLIGAVDSAGSITDGRACRELARTDPTGTVTVPMYLPARDGDRHVSATLDLIVRADGYSETRFGLLQGFGDSSDGLDPADPVARVRLRRGSAATVKLVDEAGAPLAGAPVRVWASLQSGNGTARTNASYPTTFFTGVDGVAALVGRNPAFGYRVTALLPGTAKGEREEVFVGTVATPSAGETHDFGVVSARGCGRITFAVTGPDGGPAAGARIWLAADVDRAPATPVRYTTDHVGRCTIRTADPGTLNAFAAHDFGFALLQVRCAPGEAIRVDANLTVAARLRGVAVDPDGVPLPRMRLHIRGAGRLETRDWRARFLNDVASTTRDLDYRSIESDADGRFDVPFPVAIGVVLHVSGWGERADGQAMRLGGDVEVRLGDDPPPELRLEFDVAK